MYMKFSDNLHGVVCIVRNSQLYIMQQNVINSILFFSLP